MFIRSLTAVFVLAFAFSSCKSTKPTVDNAAQVPVTLTGTFKSVQGVMDPLSCYCSNGGYITLANGERQAVSFSTEEAVSCETITVTGTYLDKTIGAEPNSPCQAGKMHILQVHTYSCK